MTPDTILAMSKQCAQAYGIVPYGAEALSDGQEKARGFAFHTPMGGSVAFAGSESILDWLTDFNCIQEKYNNSGFVHHGFATEFKKVSPQLFSIFRGLPAHYPIQVTGHSLGGALATLAAYAFASEYNFDVTLVTLGSPRVGDATFAAYVNKLVPDSIRIQHHDDLVPRVPKLEYRHIDKLLRLDDNGEQIIFQGLRGTLERWFTLAKADLEGSAERDHPIRNYLPPIEKWCQRQYLVF